MKIQLAKPTGLCFGVKRAISTIERALSQGQALYCIGSPIHNPQEVQRLQRRGLQVVEDERAVPPGATVFIRAHGVPPSVVQYLSSIGARVIDGTCPFVRHVQQRAQQLSKEGYHVVVAGDRNHPEVVGILGYVEGPWSVISDSTEMEKLGRIDRIGVVAQTTQQLEVLNKIVAAALSQSRETKVFNTICRATTDRQRAVADLATSSDGIVLIGGRNSANTGKLRTIAENAGCPVQWIEEASQLDASWFEGKERVGIAAGASTPDWLIEQLYKAIRD